MRKIIAACIFALFATNAYAAPFSSLSMDVGVCDPNAPSHCVAPDAGGAIPVTGTISATLGGFTPSASGARGTPLSVTTSDSSGNLPTGAVVIVSNVGTTNPMYCNTNGAAATTSDQLITANGGWFAFTIPNLVTTLHCIATGGTTTANTLGGAGLATGTGGGSGGSGGGGAITAASGSYASGAFSSGAFASGSYALGSIGSGAMVDLGAIADAASTAGSTGTLSAKMRLMTSQLANIPPQGQALAAASTPVVLTAIQQTALTPPAAITNFANETGGNLASLVTQLGAVIASPTANTIADRLKTLNTTLNAPMQNSGGSVTANLGTLGGAATAANQATEIASLATIATNTAGAVPAGTNTIGSVKQTDGTNVVVTDPCQAATKSYLPITATTSLVKVIAPGVSAKKIYICQITLTVTAADNVAVFEATTGTTCATSAVAVYGAGTSVATAANGFAFPANGGVTIGGGGFSVGSTTVNNNDLCIGTSAATPLTGGIMYVTL